MTDKEKMEIVNNWFQLLFEEVDKIQFDLDIFYEENENYKKLVISRITSTLNNIYKELTLDNLKNSIRLALKEYCNIKEISNTVSDAEINNTYVMMTLWN